MSALVYLLYGEDEVALKEQLAAFRSEAETTEMGALNTSVFDGHALVEGELRSAAVTAPFLASTRLVIVKNLADSAQGRALVDRLEPVLESLPEWTRLLFVETNLSEGGDNPRRRALTKLLKLVQGHPRGQVLKFDLPQDIEGWLRRRASHHGATIEPSAATMLAERIGGDMRLADTELLKLATYAGDERAITAEDVALLTPHTPEANIFKMVDALGERDGRTAIRLLHQLLDSGSEPLAVFGMIIRQYRLLLLMKAYLESGRIPIYAAEALGVRDFVARKLQRQCQRYRADQLERIYDILFELDLAIKTGQMEATLALDTLVGRLSSSASASGSG